MSYTINNIIYATKKDIISQAQSILNKTKDHQEVSISDYNFLIELFKNHDEWEEKSKNECIGITAGRSLHGTRCFYLKTKTFLFIMLLNASKNNQYVLICQVTRSPSKANHFIYFFALLAMRMSFIEFLR
ncbi:DUF3223 domain-containing protein [Escherichia coli]|nr:DUF3223 domain-containing protein [Escherichia coli]EIH8432748.1 DUF3223 domain-containing protein [Escherichia coli]EJN6671560.1 DUF3223 domain-containing protein [Escherichia coli]